MGALERGDLVTEGVGNAADLAVASLAQDEFEEGFAVVGADNLHASGLGRRAVEVDAPAPPIEDAIARKPPHPNPVGFRDVVARVGQTLGQLAVVDEQQRAAGVGIEPTDGMQAGPLAPFGGQQVEDRAPPARVATGRNDPRRFVQQHVQQFGTVLRCDRVPVHGQAIAFEVGLVAEAGGAIVDGHAPVGD